ncbi:hypothetical protein HMPREF1983_01096 [Gemella bergeri ATCC 700627]|uniref:Uncharacterized protein n=1 Tax=Gemella bergeri ATCC 700627 TaxID=1321820 RepID=U2QLV2_9BACL|nr:hypothetical protein HMPREF1983_01096 [Gemella bergeri ATCC 700627]
MLKALCGNKYFEELFLSMQNKTTNFKNCNQMGVKQKKIKLRDYRIFSREE